MSDDKGSLLNERDRRLAEEIGRHAGHHVVERLLDLAMDQEVINKVAGRWSGEAQRIVGAAVIRFLFWICGVVLLIGAWKTGALKNVAEFFSVHR